MGRKLHFLRKHPQAVALGLLTLLAFSARGAAVLALHSYEEPYTYEHGEIARNLVTGRGFTVHFLGVEGPTSQQAPVVPAALAVAYHFWGIETPAALLAFQLFQCLLGASVVPCVAALGWRLASHDTRVGWVAAAIAALHPVHVYMVTHVQVAVWATFGLVALVALVICLRTTQEAALRPAHTYLGAAVAGLLGGLLLLIEPIYALVMPLLAVALWIPVKRAETQWRPIHALGPVTLMTAVATLTVLPWLVRNYRVHGEPVFVKSTFGYAFWQGNHPRSWGTDKIPKASAYAMLDEHDGSWAGQHQALAEARSETLYIDDVLLKPHGYERFQNLSEPDRCRLLSAEVWPHITGDPGRYLRLSWQRLNFFWLCDRTNPKTFHPFYRWTSWLSFAFALAGLVLSWKDRARWWPVYGTVLLITAFHALTIVSARFRLPLEPLLAVAIALALLVGLQAAQKLLTGAWSLVRNRPSQASSTA